MNEITIKEVQTKSDLKRFISFPNKLYKGHKYHVPQLMSFEIATLQRDKNPAFEYCESKYWLAYRNDKIVGRIAGIINKRSNATWSEKKVRFGWFDFIDDIHVSSALLSTVEEWGKAKGMTAIHGPLGFCDMDMEGMLVEGFDELGTQSTIYNYPYYPMHLDELQYRKDVDWVQKKIEVPTVVPEKMKRFASLVQEKYNLRVLKVKRAKELKTYAVSMFHTLNEAFKHLYGFVELTDAQIHHYVDQYFSIIKKDFVCFVLDKDDTVVGFGISMVSMSTALQKANGHLLPFGLIPIIKSLYGRNDTVDMYLNAVHPDYQGKGVHAIYYAELMQAYIDNGIKIAISNPQLESNTRALQVWKHYNHVNHVKRRCYNKEI